MSRTSSPPPSSSAILLAVGILVACGGADGRQTDVGAVGDGTDGPGARPTGAFDSQGHRGARGLLPENSIAGARFALEQGMRTIELDLAVTRDSVLVVSHEPHFNATICGLRDVPYDEKTSIFSLSVAEVQSVDCGTRLHPEFPYQASAPGPKPTFSQLVAAADAYALELGRDLPNYNIEIKSSPELDGTYTPSPETFAALVLRTLDELGIRGRSTVQSFDPRPLAYLSREAPDVRLGGLVGIALDWGGFVEQFNYDVDVYSPHHLALTKGIVAGYQSHGLEVVPWTVNDKSRMRTLLSWGVDGIITDYPDRLREVLEED